MAWRCSFGAPGLGIASKVLNGVDAQNINERRKATNTLFQDVAARACITPAILTAAAEDRGWRVEVDGRRTPPRLAEAAKVLPVHATPGMPFDKDPGDLFGFDSNGCLLP